MASIRQHKKSANWYACITVNGKQRQFSTGLTDPQEALAVAVAAERAARKHQEAPHQIRKALEKLAEEFTPPAETNPADWMISWAASRKNEVSASTFETYRNTAKEAAAFFRSAGIRSFAAISPATITALRDQWAESTSAVTTNTKLKHLHAAFSAAPISTNPVADITPLRESKTRRREFRAGELEILLAALSGEWKAITLLGIYTGQRLNDLAVLQWRQIDLAARTITLTTSKTDTLIALPLTQNVIDALSDLPSSDSPSAPVFAGIAALSPGARSNRFRYTLHACGLATSPRGEKKRKSAEPVARKTRRTTSELSFHSLRHTATTMLKAAGVSDSIARAIIGHSSEAISRAYTHLDLATMRQALDKLPVLG